jgi:hypothetical protein
MEKVLFCHPENGSKIVENQRDFPEFVTTIDGAIRRIPINMVNPASYDTICVAYQYILECVSAQAKRVQLDRIMDVIKECERERK